MTTAKRSNFRPDRPTHVKSTQRVIERCDFDEGVSDTAYDLFAHEIVPKYKAEEVEAKWDEDDRT